jgi:hypothetical protein
MKKQAALAAFDLEATVEQLHREAMEHTGLGDFGPDDYHQPFAMLAAHLASPELSDTGRAVYHGDLVTALCGRLIREDEWKKHPEYKQRSVPAPLVICGVPRTGTTALHKLLSVDPQFQGLDNWLTSWPKPRPARADWSSEQGYQEARARLDKFFELIPEMRISHEMVADEVDECLEVLRLDFVANRSPSSYDLPEYDAWYQAQDERGVYRRLADTIRLIGLNDDRTWLLKNPGHFAEIEALLDAFPDARVIITHRDPMKSLPSLCSVLSGVRRMAYAAPDLTKLGPREVAYWGKAKQKTEAFRKQHPSDQFLDVDHRDLHHDPIAVVRRIYDHFGLQLTDETARAMEDWLAANPAGKHGEHHYELADYGITEKEIRDALGEA